ncbi:hypothetical protein [Staphylococcus rostri]|uniref:Uncharacterized protein n=1 Tax=Staphylococcus rostri TaxID=522262 RepID=A0A2K3YQP9_9STAP|nr:hypothetical protein [Staphylococcus rostri]MDO5374784.1 hypothetical protein [Staphylococcus rostri]PNZ27910.1 hypothetical protein CD122_05525 [Staphylococcus rostri]
MVKTLLIIYIIATIILYYLSTVMFTAAWAYECNVRFTFSTYFAIPFILVRTHIRLYKEQKHYDKKKARKLLMLVFDQYRFALEILFLVVAKHMKEQNIQRSKEISYRLQHKNRRQTIKMLIDDNKYEQALYTL